MNSIEKFFDDLGWERLVLTVILVLAVLIIRVIVSRSLNKRIQENQQKYRARKAVSFIAYALLITIVLVVYSDRLGGIGVTLGVVGAGVAFALQEVIISFVGWLYILSSGVVHVGNRVKIGDVKGDIIDIQGLTTTIMELGDWVDGDLYNGRIVTLSNSFIFKEQVHNYSKEFPFLWDEIRVPIRTESNIEEARELFKKILEDTCGEYSQNSSQKWDELTNKYRIESAQVEPMVSLQFNENWVTFTLRYVVDYKKRRTVKDTIYSSILTKIKARRDIHIAAESLEITTPES